MRTYMATPSDKAHSPRSGHCPLCNRITRLTFHHLIPKKMHRRTYFRKHYNKQTLALGIAICQQCHIGIHSIYNEMELAKRFNSLEHLLTDTTLSRHFVWVGKQKVVKCQR
jgi:hypothetical protein